MLITVAVVRQRTWTNVVFVDTFLGVVEHCGPRNLGRVFTYLKFINLKLKMTSRKNDSANLCRTCMH